MMLQKQVGMEGLQFNEAVLRRMVLSRKGCMVEKVSRRHVFKLLGLGIIWLNPLAVLARKIASEPFSVSNRGNSVLFYISSSSYWEIDKASFDGSPVLTYSSREGSHFVSLKNAFFPGTDLPADFSAVLTRLGSGWNVDIGFEKLRLYGRADFKSWLKGRELPLSPLDSSLWVKNSRGQSEFNIGANSSASLGVRWQLKFEGEGSIGWHYGGHDFSADRLVAKPMQALVTLCPEVERGTIFEVGHCHDTALYAGMIGMGGCGSLEAERSDSHVLGVVCGYSKNSEVVMKWLSGNGAGITYGHPSTGQTLYFPDYVFVTQQGGNEPESFRLLASAGNSDAWLSHSGGAFRLSGKAENPSWLDIRGQGDTVHDIVIDTNLSAMAIAVGGAMSIPVPVDGGRHRVRLSGHLQLEKSSQSPQKVVKGQKPVLQLDILRKDILFRPAKSFKIKVLRPEDLLFLEFEFHNMKFASKGNASYLEIDDQKRPGLMVVRFQSQHTLEEAFWEENNIKSDKKEESPVKPKLPVRYLRAGKSRLVFEIDASSEGIPLLIDRLLDWSRYNLRINPRAHVQLPELYKIPSDILSGAVMQLGLVGSSVQSAALEVAASGKYRFSDDMLYSTQNIAKIFSEQQMVTLAPSFNLGAFKLPMKPEPIPDDQTSIEAPALLYLSPNQVAGFVHRREVVFRNVVSGVENEDQLLVVGRRLLDPLDTGEGVVTELWHTALGVRLSDGTVNRHDLSKLNSIRALWGYDVRQAYDDIGGMVRNKPFRASLDSRDRNHIVHETSNFEVPGFKPSPVKVKQFMLSALGSFLDLHGLFYSPGETTHKVLNLLEWEHKATMGRDNYVKVVYAGYLYPFGHQAAVIKITERKFDSDTKAAINRQRMYVVVTEPEKRYGRNDPEGKFIAFPFIGVDILTRTTPDLDIPQNIIKGGSYNFMINASGRPFLFGLRMYDKEGREHYVEAPLIFLEPLIACKADLIPEISKFYSGAPTPDAPEKPVLLLPGQRRVNNVDFGMNRVNYAEDLVSGDAAITTSNISFCSRPYPAKADNAIKFHPAIRYASVVLDSVVTMTGNSKSVKFYMRDDNNKGQVFGTIDPVNLDFSAGSDKSGGFILPNASLTAVSKFMGPVAGSVSDAENMVFNPAAFFADNGSLAGAKLFGTIKLAELLASNVHLDSDYSPVIKAISGISNDISYLSDSIKVAVLAGEKGDSSAQAKIASLRGELAAKEALLKQTLESCAMRIPQLKSYETPSAYVTEYRWNPRFDKKNKTLFGGMLEFIVANTDSAMEVVSSRVVSKNPGVNPRFVSDAVIRGFAIEVVKLIKVRFDKLEFISDSESGVKVNVSLRPKDPIVFTGAMSFVNKLQTLIPPGGFTGNNVITRVNSSGAEIGYELAVPAVEVGVFALSNVLLGVKLALPFDGSPMTMQFNFSRRDNPFMLTISCFGGGGYLQLVTYMSGLKSVEGAFEFGGAFSLNVGVASGGVKVMGGIYYQMIKEADDVKADVAGYMRINGNLSVLGMIRVSLEFYLALEAHYSDANDKVERIRGTATLKVKVEILFFSKTVGITVSREFKGADADPSFKDTFLPQDWEDYALAFA